MVCRLFCLTVLVLGFGILTAQKNVPLSSKYIYVKVASDTTPGQRMLNLADRGDLVAFEPLAKSKTGVRNAPSVLDGLYKVIILPEVDPIKLCEELSRYSNVIYAEPAHQEYLLYTPNDPDAGNGNQSYLNVIRALDAWDINRGDSSLVIGIIDNGLDLTHEDIAPKLYYNLADTIDGLDNDGNGYVDDYLGYDFADGDPDAQNGISYHGNRVGGIAGAATDNGKGIAGIGFNTRISPLKVFTSADNTSANTYEAIVYAADQGFDVINLSWGSIGTFSQANQDIITYAAIEKNVVIVAAAGNTPEEVLFYPASYDHVLSVGATNLDDSKTSFSTYNHAVDLMAPGNAIYSTFKDDGYATDNGTSYSAPMVAGAAALVKSQFPDLNSLQIMERLRVASDAIDDIGTNSAFEGKLGFGRLNISRAVGEDTLIAIRLNDIQVLGPVEPYIYYGDSVKLSFHVTNYLSPTKVVSLSFSSSSSYVQFFQNEILLDHLDTLETKVITTSLFTLSESTPPNEEIVIKVTINVDQYDDFQYFSFRTAPDYQEIDSGPMQLMLAGNGNLGFAQDTLQNGNGLKWNGLTIASRLGVLFAQSQEEVSDNLPGNIVSAGREQDFNVLHPIRFAVDDRFDLVTSNRFDDSNAAVPQNLIIDQLTMTNENANYVILEYRLINNSGSTLDAVRTGLFVDWQLNNQFQNRNYYDTLLNAVISFDVDSSTFVAIAPPQNLRTHYQALDLSDQNGNTLDVDSIFSDSLKYSLTQIPPVDTAGWSGNGNNVASLLVDDSIKIEPGLDHQSTYILAAGEDYVSLSESIADARSVYALFQSTPPLIETFVSCEGAPLTIDPSSGDSFYFFSDPFGKNLLTINDSLTTGPISSDTTFYLANFDSGFIGPIQKIAVSLVDKVADFDMSTDTLFLDGEINSVSFTDDSFLPLNWLWDFGNGTLSTLQNPTATYDSAGLYDISLSVTNELGCSDEETQLLLVAERPQIPELDDEYLVCTGDLLTLQAVNADTLTAYASEMLDIPLILGTELEIGPITDDTTIYVTNSTGPFESLPQKVAIRIDEIIANFSYLPDTTSTDIGAIFINTSISSITATWYVDGAVVASSDTLKVSITKDNYTIGLFVNNATGCSDSLSQTLTFQASDTPNISYNQPCAGNNLVLAPSNGQFFGFYRDELLTDLIDKGSRLNLTNVSDSLMIYITGLDSILPSVPLPVSIFPKYLEFKILADPDTMILENSSIVQFSTDIDSLEKWKWYINSEFIESTGNPIVFLDSAATYSIVLEGTDHGGCIAFDSLEYVVLNEILPSPLSITTQSEIKIYPNPVQDWLNITPGASMEIAIYDMTGTLILSRRLNAQTEPIPIKNIPSGMYMIHLQNQEVSLWKRFIIE